MLNSVLEFDACDYCVQHSVFALPSKYHHKHTTAHTKSIATQTIDYKYLIYTVSIENPRVSGSNPPLGTIFTNNNIDLAYRNTRLSCVIQKHTLNTLFAVLLTI